MEVAEAAIAMALDLAEVEVEVEVDASTLTQISPGQVHLLPSICGAICVVAEFLQHQPSTGVMLPPHARVETKRHTIIIDLDLDIVVV
jgi:hypothetical protein